MGRAWLIAAGLAAFVGAPLAIATEAPASMTQRRCYICHADRETLAGPAFADIAAAYRVEADPLGTMARVIRSGAASGGPWHMPPHPEVSPREARAMARYIMSLEPAPATREPGRSQ